MAKIEVFTAGCPLCDDALKVVRETACPKCEITVYNLADAGEGLEKARAYGIIRVPAVVVDGKLSACCQGSEVNPDVLRTAGVGHG